MTLEARSSGGEPRCRSPTTGPACRRRSASGSSSLSTRPARTATASASRWPGRSLAHTAPRSSRRQRGRRRPLLDRPAGARVAAPRHRGTGYVDEGAGPHRRRRAAHGRQPAHRARALRLRVRVRPQRRRGAARARGARRRRGGVRPPHAGDGRPRAVARGEGALRRAAVRDDDGVRRRAVGGGGDARRRLRLRRQAVRQRRDARPGGARTRAHPAGARERVAAPGGGSRYTPGLDGRRECGEPRAAALVRRVAPASSSVLVQGESGTGKELVARLLHDWSDRVGAPFVAVNCAALAPGVLESELFGHERGAFTGASQARAGCFERAHGGTLFLDEIGEISATSRPSCCACCRRARCSASAPSKPRHVDVRVVAATNRNLRDAIAAGRFREDLYFRLNVIPIHARAAARAPRGHPAARALLPGASRRAPARVCPPRPRRGCSARLAGQRARARERDRAGGDPGARRDDRARGPAARAGGARRQCDGRRRARERRCGHGRARRARSRRCRRDGTCRTPSIARPWSACAARCPRPAGRRAEAARLLGVERTTLYRLMKRFGIED